MTDRYFAFTVMLTEPIRSDDAQSIMDALLMIRGVLNVTPLVADADTYAAEARAKAKLKQQLWDVLK